MVDHQSIWIKLEELSGQIRTLNVLLVERHTRVEKIELDVNVLFDRQRRQGERLAQVAIVAAISAVVIPCITALVAARMTAPPEHPINQIKP